LAAITAGGDSYDVKSRESPFGWASHELRGDRTVALAAVARVGACLRFCSAALRADEVRTIVQGTLVHGVIVHDTMASSCRIVTDVVRRCMVLSPRVRWSSASGPQEVVRAALMSDGRALEWAAPQLRADKRVLKYTARKAHETGTRTPLRPHTPCPWAVSCTSRLCLWPWRTQTAMHFGGPRLSSRPTARYFIPHCASTALLALASICQARVHLRLRACRFSGGALRGVPRR